VLYGLFLFLGASSFEDNELAYRVKMVCMDRTLRRRLVHPYAFNRVDFRVVRAYTVLQVALCCVIFGVTFTPAGVIFPVLIALLVMVRLYALPRWFAPCDLMALDDHILSEASAEATAGTEAGLEMVKELADVEVDGGACTEAVDAMSAGSGLSAGGVGLEGN
jgi:hypothetical protein